MIDFDKNNTTSPLKISIIDIAILVGFYLIANVLVGGLSMLFYSQKEFIKLVTPIVWALPFVLTLTCFYAFIMKPRKETFKLNLSFSTPIYIYPVFIIAFLGLILVNEFLTHLIPNDIFGLEKWYKMIDETFTLLKDNPIPMIITICILAPIFEEILFRGFILKGLLNTEMNPYTAIIFSALIFGFIHFNPWQFVGATLLGSFMGWIFYKTQSLLNTILLHSINNSIGCILFFMYGDVDFSDVSGYTNASLCLLGIIITSLFGYLFYQLTKNKIWNSY